MPTWQQGRPADLSHLGLGVRQLQRLHENVVALHDVQELALLCFWRLKDWESAGRRRGGRRRRPRRSPTSGPLASSSEHGSCCRWAAEPAEMPWRRIRKKWPSTKHTLAAEQAAP